MAIFVVVFVLILFLVAGCFSFIYFLKKGMTFQPPIQFHVKELEQFIGDYGLVKDFTVLEYEYQHLKPAKPLKLRLQLPDEVYNDIVSFISNPSYTNSILCKDELLSKIWTKTTNGFKLNKDRFNCLGMRGYRAYIELNNSSKTINFRSVNH